ncbi:MAG: FixH family protein [Candidatus Accumulibacter sp. UW25]
MTVIIAGFITAYLAVISNDGLVEDDYYKQGLTVNQRTARDQRAGELAIEADLVVGGSGDRIRALLRGNEEFQLPEALTLRIVHPTRPGFDQAVVLRSEGGGVYAGVLTAGAGSLAPCARGRPPGVAPGGRLDDRPTAAFDHSSPGNGCTNEFIREIKHGVGSVVFE